MKTKLLLLTILASSFANAASTIAFSSSTDFATNWGGPVGGSGDGNTSRYIWGIIVDSGRNGFLENQYTPGFSLNSFATSGSNNAGAPIALSVASGVTDDYLIMSGFSMNLTTNTTDSAVVGQNRITGLNSFSYGAGMDGGDPYKIIWFNVTSASNFNPGGTASAGLAYGTFAPATSNTIPADGTASISYAAPFDGVDSLKTMTFTVVPETSTSLLGAIGALALLRRRRN